jgi:hypothetical protein
LKFAGGAPLAATLEGEFSDVTRFRPAKVTRDLRRFADAGTGVRGSTFMGPASENLHINTAAADLFNHLVGAMQESFG